MIVGRSFALRDGRLVQTRERPYYWNPDARRIEFVDFIDNGSYAAGWLAPRDRQRYMAATIVGNPQHRGGVGIRESPDSHVIRVDVLRDGKWIDFDT